TATSVVYPYAAAVAEWNGGLVAGQTNAAFDGDDHPPDWDLSDDAGRTWRSLDEAEHQRLQAELPLEQATRRQDCASDDGRHCYRVVSGQLKVLETRDGGEHWRISWQVTDAQRQALARHYPDVDDPVRELSSVALVVHPTRGGHVVLVANGR